MTVRILHIMLADPKFLSYAKAFFDCDDFENDWALFAYDKESNKDRKNVYDFPSWEEQPELKQHFEQTASQCDVMLVHFLIPGSTSFLNAMSRQIPVVIQFWGGDYVSQLMHSSTTFLPLTHSLISNTQPKPSWLRTFGRKSLEKFRRINNRKIVLDALEIASGFLTILPEEKSIFPKKYHAKHLGARVIYGNFVSAPLLTPQSQQGLTVMLGNSATPSNNHLDFLKPLSNCSSQIDHLILPLSYGDSSYGDSIQARFEESRMSITFLRELMLPEEYETLLSQVDVLIMGHIRQQGLGNILKALQQGKTVYLHPDGINYKHFLSHGFSVRNTFDLAEGIQLISRKDQELNANLISQFWEVKKERSQMKTALMSVLHSSANS